MMMMRRISEVFPDLEGNKDSPLTWSTMAAVPRSDDPFPFLAIS